MIKLTFPSGTLVPGSEKVIAAVQKVKDAFICADMWDQQTSYPVQTGEILQASRMCKDPRATEFNDPVSLAWAPLPVCRDLQTGPC